MSDLRKAAEMALDYIKDIRDHCACEGIDCDKEDGLVEALRQALAQPEQKPKVWIYRGNLHFFDPSDWAEDEVIPLYTATPKREWVGLTDEEFKFIASKYLLNREAGLGYFQEEIEAKLKEKNT